MRKVPHFLHVLLNSDDVESDQYKAAVAQLEREPHWHATLEQLALGGGDSQWWQDARAALADSQLPSSDDTPMSSVTIDVESTLASDCPVDCESVSLNFLDPPKHPELLGRIDRYEVERVLGTGGMGVVLRAFDSDLHRVVAIKVLASHLAYNSSARRRFAREAQAAAAVVHPNVIPIFNVESDAKTPYLVMQYVAGQSLQRRVDVSGPLPVVEALRIAQQTAAGLCAAHGQGLVHRDVKPANILLEEQIERVLLSDFGLARAVDDASLTKTGIVAGTPHYMSPEQAQGEAIDPRSDLFSLGSVLYFMLSGHPPFRASSAMAVLHRICQYPHRPLIEVNRDVPIEVSRLVDRLLAKKPDQRIATAAEAERELATLLANLQQRGVSIQSFDDASPTWFDRIGNLCRHRTTHLIAAIAVGGLLIALGRTLPGLVRWPMVANQPVASSPSPDMKADPTSIDLSLTERQGANAPDNTTEDHAALVTEWAQWTQEDRAFQTDLENLRQRIEVFKLELAQPLTAPDEFANRSGELEQVMRSLERDLQVD